jgi:hypothetical protein
MKKLYLVCIMLLTFCAGFIYRYISVRNQLFPYNQLRMVKELIINPYPNKKITNLRQLEFDDISNKKEIDCQLLKGKRNMVVLVLGQSNSANYGEGLYSPKGNVFNFYKGKCFLASDPLLGASGNGGSVWTRLGDAVIKDKLFENVIIISIGVGDSTVAMWKSKGTLNHRIKDAIINIKLCGFDITHILWHQGESEAKNGTSKEIYIEYFMDMVKTIRKEGVYAPIYIAISTRLRNHICTEIQQAQMELVNYHEKIYPGPNTDQLNTLDERYDGVHFTEIGLKKDADLWLKAIKQNRH